ncbi:MAG TPA: metallophosphoesterase [Mariprofundaceae bacterium]|nr:metallophosphoesterase [Mariprofundaceae bacterium]
MPASRKAYPSLRFLLVLLIYGGIQFYVADKAIHMLGVSGWDWLPAGWAVAMLFAPLLLWRLENHSQYHVLAVAGAWVIYSWMGFSFLFFWVGLLLSLYDQLLRMAGPSEFFVPSTFLVLAAMTAAIWGYGFAAARRICVERVRVASGKLPAGFPGLRIAQISDLHLGVMSGRQRLDAVLRKIRKLEPDMLISTGDLVDAQAHFVDALPSVLAGLQLPYGKFAVTGNHERYAGLAHALEFHVRCGFRLLRGEAVEVAGIVLAGVDDPVVMGSRTDEAGMLAAIPADRFVLFLKHQPVVDPAARFDLQLSGHTHKGQIFPFVLLVKLLYPLIAGLYTLPNGAQLYVSRGTGTWGPPIRIFSPPEITLIELTRA